MQLHRYQRPRLWLAAIAAAVASLVATTLAAQAQTAVPSSTASVTADNPAWGKELPPSSAPVSHAYDLIVSGTGYQPKSGECSKEIHARYWAYGPDGKVYPTWHPAKDSSRCAFGHEHGDDPRTSELFSTAGWPIFGYTSERLMESASESSHRHEDHVGHKVLAVNNVKVIEGDDGTSFYPPNGNTLATCDVLQKFHQGTHSPDAFTNNAHELVNDTKCTYHCNGQTIEARFSALIPIGRPGGFGSTDCPGPNFGERYTNVGTAVPADSPSDTRSLGRLITGADCIQAIREGKTHYEPTTGTYVPFDSYDLHEFWFSNFTISNSQLNFTMAPLFYVLNPSRYYEAAQPNKLARQVDLCYNPRIPGYYCDQVRQQSGTVTWDDPRSPFKGTLREFRPGTLSLKNSGPTTVYTDAYGRNVSTTPFNNSIEQYFSGNSPVSGYLRGATRDYAANPSDNIHSPN